MSVGARIEALRIVGLPLKVKSHRLDYRLATAIVRDMIVRQCEEYADSGEQSAKPKSQYTV